MAYSLILSANMNARVLAYGGSRDIGQRIAEDFSGFPGLGRRLKKVLHHSSGKWIGPVLRI